MAGYVIAAHRPDLMEWCEIVDVAHMLGMTHPDLRTLALWMQKPRTVALLVVCGVISHLRACPHVANATQKWASEAWDRWPEGSMKESCFSPWDYRDCTFCKRGVVNWNIGDTAPRYERIRRLIGPEPDEELLRGRVKSVLLEHHLEQRQVAAEAGITPSTLCKWLMFPTKKRPERIERCSKMEAWLNSWERRHQQRNVIVVSDESDEMSLDLLEDVAPPRRSLKRKADEAGMGTSSSSSDESSQLMSDDAMIDDDEESSSSYSEILDLEFEPWSYHDDDDVPVPEPPVAKKPRLEAEAPPPPPTKTIQEIVNDSKARQPDFFNAQPKSPTKVAKANFGEMFRLLMQKAGGNA